MSTAGESDPCPSEEIWLKLVAGVVKKRQALRALEHCSRCENCAQRLRLAEGGLVEEEPQLCDIEPASSEWQLTMAQRIVARISAAKSQKRPHRKLIWILLVLGTAAILALVLYVFLLQH